MTLGVIGQPQRWVKSQTVRLAVFIEAVLAINNANERNYISDVQKKLLLRMAASNFVQRKF